MSDEQAQFDAVVALLVTLNAAPYDINKLPKPAPSAYTEVYVSRRFADLNDRMTGETTRAAWRVSLRAVGDDPENAREMRRRASGIENLSVSVGGVTSGPIKFESSDDIAPEDEGRWYTALSTFTYAF